MLSTQAILSTLLLSTFVSSAIIPRDDPIPAPDDIVAKIKLTIPAGMTYQDFGNTTDHVEGEGSKEILFKQSEVDKGFQIKFHYTTENWDLVCYAQAKAAIIGEPVYKITENQDNPITGTYNSNGRIWCPANEGECEPKDPCRLPVIDTDQRDTP